MNATSPISLLSALVGSAAAAPKQVEGGLEGLFADSLAAALSGEMQAALAPLPKPAEPLAGTSGQPLPGANSPVVTNDRAQHLIAEGSFPHLTAKAAAPLLGQVSPIDDVIANHPTFPFEPRAASLAGQGHEDQPIQLLPGTASESRILTDEPVERSTMERRLPVVGPISAPVDNIRTVGRPPAPAPTTPRQDQAPLVDGSVVPVPSEAFVSEDGAFSNLHQLPLQKADLPPTSDQPSRAVQQLNALPISAPAVAKPSGELSSEAGAAAFRQPALAANLPSSKQPATTTTAEAVAKGPVKSNDLGPAQAAPGDGLLITDLRQPSEAADAAYREIGRLEVAGTTALKPSGQTAAPPSTQIALHIARSIPQGLDRMSLQLHPAELGSVSIQLDFTEDGRVSALITAERSDALDMLQRDSRLLERSLSDAGVRLENNGLSFSLRQDQQQKGQGFDTSADGQHQTYQSDGDRDGSAEAEQKSPPVRMTGVRLLDIST